MTLGFSDFIREVVSDSVNGSSGIWSRGECVECQCSLTERNRGEDGRCAACSWPEQISQLRKLETIKASARANADLVVRVLNHDTRAWHLYTPDDLARMSRHVVTLCRRYQLEGGQ